MTEEKHTIDARGKRLGRVASEAAKLLMGKNSPEYAPHVARQVHVTIENASKLLLPEKKRLQTSYVRYSGYPGGQRVLTMDKMIEQKGHEEIVRKAVYGMLPGNRLRSDRMKRLSVTA
jgi:large subunit ribosomal protein L13